MTEDDHAISSEIYEEFNYSTNYKPVINSTNIVSRFPFTCPIVAPIKDHDGDFVVQRKSQLNKQISFIEIEHSKCTVLGLVGLQVWRGALLLADWLCYNNHNLEGTMVLELGSGTGLTSIAAAMFASVMCTDINKGDIFKLVEANIARNKSLLKYSIKITELNFTSESFTTEVMDILPQVQVILAADVIYDNELTEAFVKTVQRLLSQNTHCSLYIALEKRYVFTTAECDIIAPCYEYFLECINKLNAIDMEELPIDFPQSFEYDRVKELVLWKVSSNNK